MSVGSELLDKIRELMTENGITHFVVAFADPDDNVDRTWMGGSDFWKAGAALVLLEELRGDGKQD